MQENRENQFYEIRKKEFEFEVLRENTVIFTLQCEDLIQCDTALIAKQPNGLHQIYLPAKTPGYVTTWDFSKNLFCILENVKEFYYYKKSKDSFNSGLLLLKIETSNSCGYWTAIDIDFFECCLTTERAKTRRSSLFKIPYTGDSEATILEDFDYLPLKTTLIKIDNIVYLIDNLSGSIYSESARMLLKILGNVQVESLPFEWYFKVISEEGESFFTTCCHEEGCQQKFGPFYCIEKVNLKNHEEYPICYLAKNEDNKILGMFSGKLNEQSSIVGNLESMIIFDSPVKEIKLIQILKTNIGTLAAWKLSYDNEYSKILLFSISNKNMFSIILNVSDYV